VVPPPQEVASCHVLAQQLLQACLQAAQQARQPPEQLLRLVRQLVVASGSCLIHSDLLPQLANLLCSSGAADNSGSDGDAGDASSSGAGGGGLASAAAGAVRRLREQHAAMLAAVNPPLLSFSWVQAHRALDAAAASGNAEAGLQQLRACAGEAGGWPTVLAVPLCRQFSLLRDAARCYIEMLRLPATHGLPCNHAC
jgi:hypothetical protein